MIVFSLSVKDNINGKEFDLEEGEVAEVEIEDRVTKTNDN